MYRGGTFQVSLSLLWTVGIASEKDYGEDHDFFGYSMEWCCFASWRLNRKSRRCLTFKVLQGDFKTPANLKGPSVVKNASITWFQYQCREDRGTRLFGRQNRKWLKTFWLESTKSADTLLHSCCGVLDGYCKLVTIVTESLHSVKEVTLMILPSPKLTLRYGSKVKSSVQWFSVHFQIENNAISYVSMWLLFVYFAMFSPVCIYWI